MCALCRLLNELAARTRRMSFVKGPAEEGSRSEVASDIAVTGLSSLRRDNNDC